MKKLLIIALALLFTSQAYGDFYQWTDSGGKVHYTDDEKKIPDEYKEQAVAPTLKDPIVKSEYSPEILEKTEPEDEGSKEYGGKPIFYWVQQINRMESDLIEARNTVSLLENELESLEYIKLGQVRRNPIIGKFYSRPISSDSSLYFVDDNEKQLLEMKLKQVEQQVESIKQELDIFKEDAKNSGLPPKYL